MAEKCTTCGTKLSELQPAYAWQGKPYCRDCLAFITNTDLPPAPKTARTPPAVSGAAANKPVGTAPTPARKAIAGAMLLGVVAFIVVGWIFLYRVSQQEAEEKLKELGPLLKHVDFSPELRNDERFAPPFCLALPNGRHYRTVADHPFFPHDANTLAVCRVSKPEIGTYKYDSSSGQGSLTAYRIRMDVCFIDLKNPSRRRVVVATSDPPKEIQSERQYYAAGTHTLDDQTETALALHDEQALIEKVLRSVSAENAAP